MYEFILNLYTSQRICAACNSKSTGSVTHSTAYAQILHAHLGTSSCMYTHTYMALLTLLHVTWLTHVWLDSPMYVTWLIIHHILVRRAFIYVIVIWLSHMCDMTHYMWDMTHSYVGQDSLLCVTWLTHTCDTNRSCVWHDPLICVTWLTHTCDMTHWMCHMTNNPSHAH